MFSFVVCRVAMRKQFTAHCEGGIRKFPFDTQNCSLFLALGQQKSSEFSISNLTEPSDSSDPV